MPYTLTVKFIRSDCFFVLFRIDGKLVLYFFLVNKLSVRYYGSDKKILGTARLYLTALGKLNHTNKIYKNKIIIVVEHQCACKCAPLI